MAMNAQPHMPSQDRGHHDAQFFQQQMAKTTQPATPQTISPKDAVLEFNESSEEPNMPLFSHQPINFGMDHMGRILPDNGAAVSGGYGRGTTQATTTCTTYHRSTRALRRCHSDIRLLLIRQQPATYQLPS